MSSAIEVYADISGLGDFSGPLDNLTNPNRVLINRGISASRGKTQIKQFSQGQAGRCEFTLNNSSGDYSGLVPGMKVQLRLAGGVGAGFDFEDGTDFDFEDATPFDFEGMPGIVIWTGLIDDLKPDVNPFLPAVTVFCLGMLSRLVNRTVSTELIENETIDQIIHRILTAAGWPLAERVISVSTKRLTYECLDDADPYAAISRLVLTEGGSFYEDRNGYFVFEDKNYRNTQTRSTTSQADYLDAVLRNRLPSPNYKEKVDACKVEVANRAAGTQVAIWTLGEDLVLTANQVKHIPVRGNDLFKNASVPSPIGVNAEQFIKASKTLNDGTVQLGYKNVYTTDLEWDDDAATVQAALEAVLETVLGAGLGVGSVLVGGESFNIGFTVHFRKTLKEQEVELLTVRSNLNPTTKPATIKVVETRKGVPDDGSGLPPLPANEIQTLFSDSTLVSGQWTVNNNLTALSTTATSTNLQAVLDAIFGSGNRLAAGGPIGTADMTVEAIGSDALSDVALLEIHSVSGNPLLTSEPTATLNIVTTVKGGGPDFVVTAGSLASVDPITLNRTSGASLMLTIRAGATGATVTGYQADTGIQLRAQPFSVVRTHPVAWPEEASDATWVDDFLVVNNRPPRIERPDIHPGLSRSDALMFCEDFVDAYDELRQTDEIEILKGLDAPDLDSVFVRDPSDRLNLTPGHAFIEQVNYAINDALVAARFGMEQVAA